MPGITNRSAQKLSSTVRTVKNQPRNLVGQRRQTYPTGGGKEACKLVKIWNHDNKKASTAVAQAYKIEWEIPDGTTMDSSAGYPLTLTQTGSRFIVGNPRNVWLRTDCYYFAYSVGGKWLIDNQAVFAEDMA